MQQVLESIKTLKCNHNYIEYPQPLDTHLCSSQKIKTFLQKQVESTDVCQLNDKLFINIDVNVFNIDNHSHNCFDVKITAQKKDEWWTLSCYSLSSETIIDKIESIESKLVELFNEI